MKEPCHRAARPQATGISSIAQGQVLAPRTLVLGSGGQTVDSMWLPLPSQSSAGGAGCTAECDNALKVRVSRLGLSGPRHPGSTACRELSRFLRSCFCSFLTTAIFVETNGSATYKALS
jgi:hypothetical protein